MKKVCIIGGSGKLGQYMIEFALSQNYRVVAVCREKSINKIARFKGQITIIPGATNDRDIVREAVNECNGILTVLVPWGMQQYATGTARAVLEQAPADARLIFSCGWHITRDGRDVYPLKLKLFVKIFGFLGRIFRLIDLEDQIAACQKIFTSKTLWTVVRGSDLEEGPSQGLPVWSRHVGDPILESNLTRRVDFAMFMVHALTNDKLIHEAPAIVGCRTRSALLHTDKKTPEQMSR